MGDPFLHLHKVRPGVFEFSGLRTASIRDQMLRAYIAVKRCAKIGLIGSKRPLLIIGGGAGGATAAMAAATLDIEVVLFEAKNNLFTRQLLSPRYIDPTEYDWPAMHWDEGKFPWSTVQVPAALPLDFVADDGNKLANQWMSTFVDFLNNDPQGARIQIKHQYINPKTDVHSAKNQRIMCRHVRGKSFGVAMSFVGFKEERVSTEPPSSFTGFRFWEPDPYSLQNFNLPLLPTPVAVISGGGDGALQDFIRLLTGKSAKACFEWIQTVNAPFKKLHHNRGVEVNLFGCMAADELVHRTFPMFSNPKDDAHSLLAQWHDFYVNESGRLYNAMDPAARTILKNSLRDVDVRLVHSCTHFDFCYSLNRLLVLILARLYAEKKGISLEDVLIGSTVIGNVQPAHASHSCKDASTCHNYQHDVSFNSRTCPGQIATSFITAPLIADMTIIRHGVVPTVSFGVAPVPNQTLPYWIDSP